MLENLSKELNRIALLEFKANWDKSELVRIFNEGEHTKAAKELEEKLQKEIKEVYVVKISGEGSLQILKKESENMYKQEKFVLAPISYKLPYSYTMGKKVGKKVAQEILDKYSYLLD